MSNEELKLEAEIIHLLGQKLGTRVPTAMYPAVQQHIKESAYLYDPETMADEILEQWNSQHDEG